MVGLCRSSTVQFVVLTDGVGSRKDFDPGLDRTLSEVTTPKNHLRGVYVIRNVEVPDGTTTTLGGSTLYGGLRRGVEALLRSGPGFLHSGGIGNFGAKLE